MSHEIRTPMNSILGFAEILYDREEDDLNKNYLNIITSSGKTLLTLLNDVLDLSKIETERLVLNMEPVGIDAIFKEVKLAFATKLEDKKLNFISDMEQGLPYKIMFDEVRLRQIIFNLVNNAIKYTNAGFVRLSAHFKYKQGMEEFINLTIEVEDSGIGIPDENKSQIFEAFNQKLTGPGRQLDGSGLGLSIAKRLTEMLSGTIHVESTLGKGSKFALNFPIVEVVTEKEIPIAYPKLGPRQKMKFSTIMFADGSEYYRELVNNFVAEFNIKMIDAVDYEEVKELLNAIKPDLIVLDVTLSEGDPFEVAENIKNNEILNEIPIIAVVAEDFDLDNEKAKLLFDNVISKPFVKKELINIIRRFVNLTYVSNELLVTDDDDTDEEKEVVEVDFDTLLQKLRTDIKLKIDDLALNPNIKKIQSLGGEINNIASTYNNDYLHVYAQCLLDKAKKSEEDNLNSILLDFEHLIDCIKNQESIK